MKSNKVKLRRQTSKISLLAHVHDDSSDMYECRDLYG